MISIQPAFLASLFLAAAFVPEAQAQFPCQGSTGPDLVVGDVSGIANYNSVSGLEALALGTTSCNLGTVWVNWFPLTNQHPVIAANLYRFKVVDGSGRFEQVGLSWATHGFNALSQTFCCATCSPDATGNHLGVGCSSPDTASSNGSQPLLGPRYQVNGFTGALVYPPTHPSGGNRGRVEVLLADLEPTGGAGAARYFGECVAVAADDAAAGNSADNATYRELGVSGSGSAWTFSLTSTAHSGEDGLAAWAASESGVRIVEIRIPNEGVLVLASRVTPLGGTRYHYEYALRNRDSDLGVASFSVPIPSGIVPSGVGFHGVVYRGGDGAGGVDQDGTDWTANTPGGEVSWATQSFAQNPNANAIRWGTVYNFRFDADSAPGVGTIAVGTFKDGGVVYATSDVPGASLPGLPFCAGDGSLATPCPCANVGAPGRGCANSQASAGALLSSSGSSNPDTVVLTVSSTLPSSLCIFLQSAAQNPSGIPFGDGLRCASGPLLRLYLKTASAGVAAAPAAGDASITARSAALGDPIVPGSTRFYQTYYRDGNPTFCPSPQGSSFNVSNGQVLVW